MKGVEWKGVKTVVREWVIVIVVDVCHAIWRNSLHQVEMVQMDVVFDAFALMPKVVG